MKASRFLEATVHINMTDMQLCTSRPAHLVNLDAKIFSVFVSILVSNQTDEASRIITAIRQTCVSGCGRQVIRVIDKDFAKSGPRRRQVILAALHELKPVQDLPSIEHAITKLEGFLLELCGAPEMPTGA